MSRFPQLAQLLAVERSASEKHDELKSCYDSLVRIFEDILEPTTLLAASRDKVIADIHNLSEPSRKELVEELNGLAHGIEGATHFLKTLQLELREPLYAVHGALRAAHERRSK